MQVAILAGGLGTRIRAALPGMPKVLAPVAGRPFLFHLLRMLRRHGLHDFVFLLGYRAEQVVDFLDGLSDPDLNLSHSVEPTPVGTGGALRLASNLLADEFLLINGDSYLDMDYRNLVQTFQQSLQPSMMVVYGHAEETDVIPNVAMADDGRVLGYQKGGGDGFSFVDAGVLALRKDVLDYIGEGTYCSLEQEIYPQLIERKGMVGFTTPGRFYDIGTPQRLAEFERYLHDHIPDTIQD